MKKIPIEFICLLHPYKKVALSFFHMIIAIFVSAWYNVNQIKEKVVGYI